MELHVHSKTRTHGECAQRLESMRSASTAFHIHGVLATGTRLKPTHACEYSHKFKVAIAHSIEEHRSGGHIAISPCLSVTQD